MIGVYAERMRVAFISSATAISAFRMISTVTGLTGVLMVFSLPCGLPRCEQRREPRIHPLRGTSPVG